MAIGKNRAPSAQTTQSFLIQYRIELLLGLVILLFIVIIYLLANPPYINQLTEGQRIVTEVTRRTSVERDDVFAVREIDDAESLRARNSVMAEVYANAEDNDFVIAANERIIIYRDGDERVIYDGPTPAVLQSQREQELIATIRTRAVERNLAIQEGEAPQLTAVTDPASLQEIDPTFYAGAQSGDIVAVFPQSEIIVLYRPSTSALINSGSFATNIQ